jgi:hypothetical protein
MSIAFELHFDRVHTSVIPACALLEFAHSCCLNGAGVNHIGRQQVGTYLVSRFGMDWVIENDEAIRNDLAAVEMMMSLPEYQGEKEQIHD